jgi:hypothetical protein
MLRAQFVPATTQTAFEQRECGFDAIRVGIASHVIPDSMLDHFVLKSHALCDAGIQIEFVGEQNFDILSKIIAHELFNRLRRDVLGVEQAEFAIALADADNRALLGSTSTSGQSLPATANVSFINFDFSVEHWFVRRGHCCPDSVAEIPCCLVADSEGALYLAGGHTLFRLTEKQRCHEPLREWEMAIVENRASRHRKLIVAALAVEKFALCPKLNSAHLAARAFNASRPAQAAKQFTASFVSRKVGHYVC